MSTVFWAMFSIVAHDCTGIDSYQFKRVEVAVRHCDMTQIQQQFMRKYKCTMIAVEEESCVPMEEKKKGGRT